MNQEARERQLHALRESAALDLEARRWDMAREKLLVAADGWTELAGITKKGLDCRDVHGIKARPRNPYAWTMACRSLEAINGVEQVASDDRRGYTPEAFLGVDSFIHTEPSPNSRDWWLVRVPSSLVSSRTGQMLTIGVVLVRPRSATKKREKTITPWTPAGVRINPRARKIYLENARTDLITRLTTQGRLP